ncbi:hypothetical protein VNO77_18694 [Canavalia gladiata]|uniref:Uncharacterized protein n=1 Tax=Canavalia gladiata TaxID=3824 RepID=A0AAN9LL68_CANGL
MVRKRSTTVVSQGIVNATPQNPIILMIGISYTSSDSFAQWLVQHHNSTTGFERALQVVEDKLDLYTADQQAAIPLIKKIYTKSLKMIVEVAQLNMKKWVIDQYESKDQLKEAQINIETLGGNFHSLSLGKLGNEPLNLTRPWPSLARPLGKLQSTSIHAFCFHDSQSIIEPLFGAAMSLAGSFDISSTVPQSKLRGSPSSGNNDIGDNSLRQPCGKIILNGLEFNLKPMTYAEIFPHMLNWLVNWDQRQWRVNESNILKSWRPDKAIIAWLHSCCDVIWLLVNEEKVSGLCFSIAFVIAKGLSRQGKKQDPVDQILSILSNEQALAHYDMNKA